MKTSIKIAALLTVVCLGAACEQAPRDIRAPLKGKVILVRDLTGEARLPSKELNQTIDVVAQNKDVLVKIIVKKGSALAPEIERQVADRNLRDRVQLVEQ